jgi:hypothetical protein
MGFHEKEELTVDVLEELLKCILGWDEIRLRTVFNHEDFNIEQYKKENMSQKLRRYILVRSCTRIRRGLKDELTAGDIEIILRNIMKKIDGYKLLKFSETTTGEKLFMIDTEE